MRALSVLALAAALILNPGSWLLPPARAQSAGNFTSLTTSGPNSLGGMTTAQGDLIACSGHPWYDLRCAGAKGDDATDDTAAVRNAIATAITNDWPLHIPAGTYKVTGEITIDYAGIAGTGFHLISEGATLDGRAIASGPVLQVQCGGGTVSSPAGCFYFREEGALFVEADTPAYAVVIGKPDFSDAQNSAKIDHLVVTNTSTTPGAGAVQLNYVLDSDIYAVGDSSGGGAGLALEQVQFSRISGAGSASGTGGSAMLLEQGYNFSNTVFAIDLENAPTCLAITFPHDGMNTFVSPYFDCNTAVNATASTHNTLINPNYGGLVVNKGPQSTGIEILGKGNDVPWQFPSAATVTAAPIDGGTILSSYNAPGAALSVTLPAPAAAGNGWWMGFATDNGKGLSVTTPSGAILAGGKSLSSLVLGSGNYEYAQLQSDGSNYRLVAATRNTRLANGLEAPPWPSNWLYPSTPGYAATLGDNGNILSSYNTASGLTVTLPPTSGLPTGWAMGFATDNGKGVTVQVNGSGGGHIVYPGSGSALASVTMPVTSQGAYEFLALQYDGAGNFRIVDATPATAQALGEIGSASLSHWSFPAVSAYSAGIADNGNAIGSDNSPAGYLTVTLPSATAALPMGWTMGFAADNGKVLAVQVNPVSGGRIVYPGAGAGATSVQLANGNYEFLALRYDGANFRVTEVTPATATAIGVSGNAPGLNRWSFPAVTIYQAGVGDNGNVLSSYNASGGLTVTLPQTTAIAAGWTIGLARDNGEGLTVQVNGTNGGRILYPAGAGGTSATTLSLAAVNDEFAALQFDGSNFRLVAATPRTAGALGMLGHQVFTGTAPAVGSGASDCGTAPVVAGNDSAGRVTVGSGANGGKCTITFAQSWPSPPVCTAFDETSGVLLRPTGATTALVALSGALTAGDVLSYSCRGYQ